VRNVFLVAYDISDDKRRTRVYNKLKGYGEAVQFSIFRCRLTPRERLLLREEMWGLIDHSKDRLMLVDLGPDDGRGRSAIDFWGKPLADLAAGDGPLIV